jgi:hypothetical protein
MLLDRRRWGFDARAFEHLGVERTGRLGSKNEL